MKCALKRRSLTFKFCGQPQIIDGPCAYLKGTLHKPCPGEGEGGDYQLLVLQVQPSKPIEPLEGVGVVGTDVYFPPKWPRQRWDRSVVGFRPELAELKSSDIGKIIYQRYKRAERCDEVLEGEECEGFTERRETRMELFFADVFDSDLGQREAAEIA